MFRHVTSRLVMVNCYQVGSATSIGEQPIKGLVDPGCGARMSVGEALTNLVWAPITDIKVGRK